MFVFMFQVRAKLSTFGGFGGPTEVTCGGNALKFYASMRLNIKRIGLVKKGEEVSIQNLITDFEFQALTFTKFGFFNSSYHLLMFVRLFCCLLKL